MGVCEGRVVSVRVCVCVFGCVDGCRCVWGCVRLRTLTL